MGVCVRLYSWRWGRVEMCTLCLRPRSLVPFELHFESTTIPPHEHKGVEVIVLAPSGKVAREIHLY